LAHWTLGDIDWTAFDAGKVDPDLLAIVKTSALVEANAADYVAYLEAVFAGDEAFVAAARDWGAEERQHGAALGRWAALADPGFDLATALRHFRAGYAIPAGDAGSVRGSRAAELVARQVVETGTSSFYSALRDAAREPVLKAITARIAADEFRHYKLFADHGRRYAGVGRSAALKIVATRFAETGDEELGWAWYAANIAGRGAPPCRPRDHARTYNGLVARLYRPGHVEAGVRMLLRAMGLAPRGPALAAGSLAMRGVMRWRGAMA
jgi:rubrerythrin